jgi:sarcosine oxidase
MTYDTILLGLGGVGSAAAYHLARAGVRVLAIDRFAPGHDRGSSHGHSRVIRLAYYEHPDYVPLLRKAYELWEQLQQQTGTTLFHKVGVLQVGPPNGSVIPGVLASAREHNLDLETIAPDDFSRRFPGFVLPEGFAAVFEANAGYLLVEQAVEAHAQLAQQAGATLQTDETVTGWQPSGQGVTVSTNRDTYHAGKLVITAGAWAGGLLPGLPPLNVLKKPLYWLPAPADAYLPKNGSPCFFYDTPQGYFYGFPQLDARGVKVARHSGGTVVDDPLNVDRGLDLDDFNQVSRFIGSHLPQVATTLGEFATCMYTMSPDEHFIVDTLPNLPQVAFAAGLSGHGFKFTSVLGYIVAELATTGQSSLPIEFLRLER